jgi:hypothetical protein
MDLIGTGLRQLAGGIRRGNAALGGLGAAMLAVGWLRRPTRPRKELLYARTLRPGETLRIRLLADDDAEHPGDAEELEIEG